MLGDAPPGWTVSTIGEIAAITMGQSPPSSVVNDEGEGLPFIQGNAEFGARYPAPRQFAADCPKVAQTGDILLSVRAPVGEVNIAPERLCIGRGLAALRPVEGDPDFLYFSLGGLAPVFARLSQGSTFDAINGKDLRSIPVAVPPLDEQRRIAEVLRSVDEAIAAADQVTFGLERAASEIAARAFAAPDAVELEYEITTFGDLFDIKGGNQPPKSSFIYQPKEGYVRLLQIRDFEGDDKAAYISGKASQVRCDADDILIARYGASVGRILTGKAGAYNVALTKIVFRDRKILRRYAYHWLKSDYFQDRIRAVSNRSAQAGFNKEDLFPTKIALPPLSSQTDIAEALDDIESAVLANRDQRKQMIEFKCALLDDLLSGRVRVPA